MPIYEYRCKSCGHTFEVIQKFSDRPIRKCEECSGKVEKLISRSGFILKGGGWYANDYSKGPSSNTAKSSACSTGDASSKGGGGKD